MRFISATPDLVSGLVGRRPGRGPAESLLLGILCLLLMDTGDAFRVDSGENRSLAFGSVSHHGHVDCSTCPGTLSQVNNNIQITTRDLGTVGDPATCTTSCSSCDNLMPLANAQLAANNRVLEQQENNTERMLVQLEENTRMLVQLENNNNRRLEQLEDITERMLVQLENSNRKLVQLENITERISVQLENVSKNQSAVDPNTNRTLEILELTTLRPRDCAEVLSAGYNTSGRYVIYPADDNGSFPVFCDMETTGGGWTVFQRRQDGSVDFFLEWLDYKNGFGSLEGEHWLGNDKIHRLTSQKTYELRVDLEDFEGNTRYAEYDIFTIGDEESGYRLRVGGYHGNAGDDLSYHNGMKFTTKDRDMDTWHSNCAQRFTGAWWYRGCHHANLNGAYLGGPNTANGGVNWRSWRGYEYSHKHTEMKIRPIN